VVYDIVHSPSYQVPVLYITLSGLGVTSQHSPEDMYKLLVPEAYKEQIRAVGVMGALSMTEHPLTGLPAYFVHPCRTQDAMIAVGDDSNHCSAISYLTRWIGLVGSSVGLYVPIALAEALGRAKDVETYRKLERGQMGDVASFE